jgi:hypothetical protein
MAGPSRVASQTDRDRRALALLAVGVLTVVATAAMWPVLSMTGESRVPLSATIVVALAWAGLASGWQALRGPGLGAAIGGLAGAALLSKPWLAPITSTHGGVEHVLSPTSETHLYFVLPGLGLLAVAGAIVAGFRIWVLAPASTTAKAGGEIERLELPRPRPPEPPR